MDYLALGISAGISLFSAVGSFSSLRRARIIEDTPTSKIRSASQGYVEIIGMADAADDFGRFAPLTKTRCLWYRFKIEEYRRSGKNSRWHTVDKGSSDAPFTVWDSSGRCLVLPLGAEVKTHRKKRWQGSERYPSGFQGGGSLLSLGGRYRYTEETLCIDDPLYILGDFQTRHPPSRAELNEAAQAQILSEWKQDYDKLLSRFDQDGSGNIDMQEWEIARQEALRKAKRDTARQPSEDAISTLGNTGDRRRPFIIATTEPKSLSRRFRWQAFFLFALSLICAAGATWMMISPQAIQ